MENKPKKATQIAIRFTEEEKKMIQMYADEARRKPSDFCRNAILTYIELQNRTKR